MIGSCLLQVVVDDVSNNQELLWGLNGAAAVFGIVTKIVFELADVSNFYGGMIMWKDDAEHQTWRYGTRNVV